MEPTEATQYIPGARLWLAEMPEADKRTKLLWWQERGLYYTQSGYGAKIPTGTQVRHNGRWKRVYCSIWGNAGTCWIQTKVGRIIVE